MTNAADDVDGRRLRREQNREAVLDALVELFAEGVYQPGASGIAERAGLSERSLFRYFEDIDDLIGAAIERQLAAARPLLDVDVDPSTPTAEKVERVVEARLGLFEAIAPAARAARVAAPSRPVVAEQVHAARSFHRRQLRRLFAAELAAGDRAAATFPAVDALCSFETYDLLRGDQRLSRTKAAATLVAALTALLAPAVT